MIQNLLKDVVYRRIREMIINGSLPMGSKLSETVLANRLAATKAPVRDALRRLQSEGLVQIKPKSGTFVFVFNDSEFNELLEFRYYIESKAMALSLNKNPKQLVQEISFILDKMAICISNSSSLEYISLDNLFHEALFSYCQNIYFQRSYELISSRMATARNYLGSNQAHMNSSFEQHMEIVSSLKGNDIARAQNALRRHILPDFGSYWDCYKF
ncbi:GntR family transcriptional regulator [Affinibrenneria salicis]|uniref:GntR family transcriptional regulator n=1 Tax=Affinibrenneria salicis TaxID=2590031 RepID=A0A5J5FT11_9GAMM|nr:GntR family transcriptional regulator [Affinibrenneria salicis]KAA8996670.1 GntR family transcriptional regulator [Affinibrenneria salicis]